MIHKSLCEYGFCPWDDVHVKIQNPLGDDREHGDW
jgi:hypothetical protein